MHRKRLDYLNDMHDRRTTSSRNHHESRQPSFSARKRRQLSRKYETLPTYDDLLKEEHKVTFHGELRKRGSYDDLQFLELSSSTK